MILILLIKGKVHNQDKNSIIQIHFAKNIHTFKKITSNTAHHVKYTQFNHTGGTCILKRSMAISTLGNTCCIYVHQQNAGKYPRQDIDESFYKNVIFICND